MNYNLIDLEKTTIIKCLYENKGKTLLENSILLGISERTLYRKLKQYDLDFKKIKTDNKIENLKNQSKSIFNKEDINLQILEKISDYCKKYPELRFHQILFNMNINEFSDEVLNNIKERKSFSIYTYKDKYSEDSLTTLQKLND